MNSALLPILASPRRQEILRLVWTAEQSAGTIHEAMSDVSFAAVSQQLRTLHEAGLVTVRVDGRHRYYRAERDSLGDMAAMLERMWDDALWRLKIAAELEQARRGPKARRPASRTSNRSTGRPTRRTTPNRREKRT